MAEIYGNLWEYNLARVVVVDVSDDYTLMQPPMPSDCYPVIRDTWLPRHNLSFELAKGDLVMGYLYDWHEAPNDEGDCWYVGVVKETLARSLGAYP